MTDFTRCHVCDEPGTFANAADRGVVRCNVREFRDESFTVWRCTGCGSLHCLEEVDLDKYYANYPVRRQAYNFLVRTAYSNYVRRLRSAGFRREHALLDFGCGKGHLVKFLRQSGYRDVSGFDVYSEKFSDPACLSRTYHGVIAQDVIEHVADPRETLRRLVELLNPGAMLCIGTPNAARLKLDEDFSIPLHMPYHRHILSRRALVSLAAKLGCQTVASWDRYYLDTLWPLLNYRFVREYVRRCNNELDAIFELPRLSTLIYPPSLVFYALFGYFFAPRSEMMVIFRKS